MSRTRKIKTIILFSGGLDSILVAEILKRQKKYCEGLFFTSPFWETEKAKLAAKKLRIKLNIFGLKNDYLKIIKRPQFGRGKQMNPCLDCRIFMLRQAKKFIRLKNFDILATGEVLGQRPMTQNRKSLNFIEKRSGLSRKILRPLSAKFLPEKQKSANGFGEKMENKELSYAVWRMPFD
jgi:tRNA U34 2-thiouridine synthase MnmA/TrmU